MATHASPESLAAAMHAAGIQLDELARQSGLREDFVHEAMSGERRLGTDAMRALAEALSVEWHTLRCDSSAGRTRRCGGCEASNMLKEDDLIDVDRSIVSLLAEAKADQTHVTEWPSLESFTAARAALIAVGSDLLVEDLQRVGIGSGSAIPGDAASTRSAAIALARYLARGDVETEELVGLDIDLDCDPVIPITLPGWDLIRLSEAELDAYEVWPGATSPSDQPWDRKSAAATWWLRRRRGSAAPFGRYVFSISDPTTEALEPLLAIALANHEPPRAISHVTAQRGRGVARSMESQQTDYVELDDGRIFPQYGLYLVQAAESAAWINIVTNLGAKVADVSKSNRRSGDRYLAAASEFLGVTRTLYDGWGPLPRTALDMSTVAEKLLLSGANEGEIIRRVSLAAGWLGGIDDEDRMAIRTLMKTMYDAGSKYRHGGTPYHLLRGDRPTGRKKELDVLPAYDLLRRLLMHGLAVEAAGESIAELCDAAQAFAAPRVRLEEILTGLYADLGSDPVPFQPDRRRPLT